MAQEQHKRQRRIPLTREEVEAVIEFKRRREHLQLLQLKKSRWYLLCNIFNVSCFFIFCELVFCYLGPCSYQTHYTIQVRPDYGIEHTPGGQHILDELDVRCAEGRDFKLIVRDYLPVPPRYTRLNVGSDFLLGRELKAGFDGNEKTFRLFSASPVLFLCLLSGTILLVAMCYNLNENEHSLFGLTTVAGMTLLCVLFI